MRVWRVHWEERLLRELDDLELQAEGLHLAERDATVAELSQSTYAEVALVDRLHASVGLPVTLVLSGGTVVEGVVSRAGRDWLALVQGRVEYVARLGAVVRVRGASARAVAEEARGVTAKLGLGSVLRQVARDGRQVALTGTDGLVLRGSVRRVGRDFLELELEGGGVELLGFGGLAVLRLA
ncbi:MAG TPA: hypothetical protein VFK52_01910 [Nocardioidaceae bacterium]|nr:hypothetical protein [Nocardioidaceae bacterium]